MASNQLDNELLFREYAKSKSVDIRDKLVVNYLYIADILARKFVGRGIDYDDIYQIASLALIYAVERYDVSKGFEFSSFATPTIIGEIKKHFRDKGWMIRVPRRLQELSKLVNVTKTSLEQELQREVTVSDLATKLETSEDEIIEAIEASMVYNTKSLDLSVNNSDADGELNLMTVLGKEDRGYEDVDNDDFIENCLSNLKEFERIIIIERFLENKTQVEVANILGVSQMTVSRMEKKLIAKFKDNYNKYCNK